MRPQVQVIRTCAGTAVFCSSLLLPRPALAVDVCYDISRYPAVHWLDESDGNLRIWIRGKFSTRGGVNAASAEMAERFLSLGPDGRLSASGVLPIDDCFRARQAFKEKVRCPASPPVPFSWHRRLYPEAQQSKISSRVTGCWGRPGARFFEAWVGDDTEDCDFGCPGKVALGREKKGRIEWRSPPELRDLWIVSAEMFHGSLWMGTTDPCGGIGPSPALGLVRYDGNAPSLNTFRGAEDGPCGFVPASLLARQGVLWVGTELGLSRFDPSKNRWTNYLLDTDSVPPVRETDCRSLYRQLKLEAEREGRPDLVEQLILSLKKLGRPVP